MANAMQNERLKLYIAAEKTILNGQSYTIGNRSLTRANLSEVRKAIDDLLAAGATTEPGAVSGGYSQRSKRVLLRDV